MPAHRPRNFLLMVARRDYCFFIFTEAIILQHKDKVPAEGTAHQFWQKPFFIYNLVFKLFIVIIFVATISLNISVYCHYYEISLRKFYIYLLYLYSKNRMVLNPHSVLMARNSLQNKPIIPRKVLSISAPPFSGR